MNEALYRYYDRPPAFSPKFLLTPSMLDEINQDTLYQTYLKEPTMITTQQAIQNLIKACKTPSDDLRNAAAANAIELDNLRSALSHVNDTLNDIGINQCLDRTPMTYRMMNRMGLLRTKVCQDHPSHVNRLHKEAEALRNENTQLKTANNTLYTANTQQGEKIAELIKERNAAIRATAAPSHVTPDHANLLDKCHALLKHWKTKEVCNLLRDLDQAAKRSEGALRTEPLDNVTDVTVTVTSNDNCSATKVAEAMQATSVSVKQACDNLSAGSKTVSANKHDAPPAFSELNEPLTYHIFRRSLLPGDPGGYTEKIVAHSISSSILADAIAKMMIAAEPADTPHRYVIGSSLDL